MYKGKKKVTFILAAMLLIICTNVYAHPGRLDSNGGHYNRKTGEYHYHRGTGSSSSSNSSSNSTSGGYTSSYYTNKISEKNETIKKYKTKLNNLENKNLKLKQQNEKLKKTIIDNEKEKAEELKSFKENNEKLSYENINLKENNNELTEKINTINDSILTSIFASTILIVILGLISLKLFKNKNKKIIIIVLFIIYNILLYSMSI